MKVCGANFKAINYETSSIDFYFKVEVNPCSSFSFDSTIRRLEIFSNDF